MALTFTWSITGLKTKNQQDFQDAVVQTYWTVIGVDENGVSGTFNGATPLTLSNTTSTEFIQFGNLTEEQVIGWVQSSINSNTMDHVTAQIQKQIDATVSPIVDKKLPWNPIDESTV